MWLLKCDVSSLFSSTIHLVVSRGSHAKAQEKVQALQVTDPKTTGLYFLPQLPALPPSPSLTWDLDVSQLGSKLPTHLIIIPSHP